MNIKRREAVVAAILWLAAGVAGATESAPACQISGKEKPASVCAAHIKTISATCFICHGPNGRSVAAIPGLAGQDKDYLVTAMREFRDGKRESTVMQKYALGYTDREYEAIAAFFAAIK